MGPRLKLIQNTISVFTLSKNLGTICLQQLDVMFATIEMLPN